MENLKNKVIIRDLSERDFEDIENIIADTWHYNDFAQKTMLKNYQEFFFTVVWTKEVLLKLRN